MIVPAYISWTHDTTNLLHRVEIGTQTTVHGEDLLVDDGSNWQAVEAIGKGLPQLDVISSLAFVVETVDSVDRGTLVVTAEDEEVFRVFDLVGQEQADGLKGLLSTVDVVTKEKVVCLWWETAILEKTEEIVILAVDITTNLGLLAKSFACRRQIQVVPLSALPTREEWVER